MNLVFLSICRADIPTGVSAILLDEDKPPCIQETDYEPVGDGSNALVTTLVYFGKTVTNANGEVVNEMPAVAGNENSSLNSPVAIPDGAKMLLSSGAKPLGPPILTSYHQVRLQVTLSHSKPTVLLHGLHPGIVTLPIVQIYEETDRPLRSVTFDLVNDSHPLLDQQGFVTDEYFDEKQFRVTTNYFACYDINLAPGTNTIRIYCHYTSGSTRLATVTYVLRLDLKKSPKFRIIWPPRGLPACNDHVTIFGQVDDPSDLITAEVNTAAGVERIEGIVERNNHFWLENVPLVSKTNQIVIIAKDVVGHVTRGKIAIVRSDDSLTINPVPPRQLWQMQVTVSGKVNPPNREVWINGIRAKVEANGDWMVRGIAMTNSGVAIFTGTIAPLSGQESQSIKQNKSPSSPTSIVPAGSIDTMLATNEMILNSSQPTYGSFKIHLTGPNGQNFVLQDSTNLVEWVSISTNVISNGAFDYSDTNMLDYGCRFFRIVPLH